MLFQALAQYQLAKAEGKKLNLDVSFQLPGRTEYTNHRIDVGNILRVRSEEVGIFSVTTVHYHYNLVAFKSFVNPGDYIKSLFCLLCGLVYVSSMLYNI